MTTSATFPDRGASLRHGGFREDLGVWISTSDGPRKHKSPALFLDRDGVVVEETNYLRSAKDVVVIEGAPETIAMANRLGVPVVVVTNQAGIGRGYYEWQSFIEVEAAVKKALERAGAWIDAVLACPFHPEGLDPWRHSNHPARKPNPGMLEIAETLLNLNLRFSWIVGDHVTDIRAGYRAGLQGALHVLTGHGGRERAACRTQSPDNFELRFGDSIIDAVPLIESLAKSRRLLAE